MKFTDVSTIVAKDLNNIGLVCDALFTDFDNDGWQDDGERKYGRDQLDVASYLVCRRTRCRAFLGHLRKEAWLAAGPSEATATQAIVDVLP